MVPKKVRGLDARKLRNIRKMLAVGDGHFLSLEKVHGIVRVELFDAGENKGGFDMLKSTATVFVWTRGDPERVLEHVEEMLKKIPDTWIVPVVFEARPIHRLIEWLRWMLWRFVFWRQLRAMARDVEKAKRAPRKAVNPHTNAPR